MTYVRPGDRQGALRLHMNENTGAVLRPSSRPSGRFPPKTSRTIRNYSALVRECAAYLGVTEPQLVLTNGLDEGLWALTVSAFRMNGNPGGLPEAIVPVPAFEMYSVFIKAAGGRMVAVDPKPGFEFPTREICDAITDRTRIIFLTNPNNPTGQLIPRDATARNRSMRAARRHHRD